MGGREERQRGMMGERKKEGKKWCHAFFSEPWEIISKGSIGSNPGHINKSNKLTCILGNTLSSQSNIMFVYAI